MAPPPPNAAAAPWCAAADLHFQLNNEGQTILQGGATAPLRLQRNRLQSDGRCELPLLHTAGGLVGGDQLRINLHLQPGSRALVTSVAAQKVYGSRGRSRLHPQGRWARLELLAQLGAGADLEWLPQETLVFAGGLLEQRQTILLEPGASWLGTEVVRLGRTAAGEGLGEGCWRSSLELRRGDHWQLVDRLQLQGEALQSAHGMAGEPVFASLVWAAPHPLEPTVLLQLLEQGRQDRSGLPGEMALGSLEQGVIARYRGPSSQAARFWFTRLWARIRAVRGLPPPELPRVWPFQEQPFHIEASASKASGAGQS